MSLWVLVSLLALHWTLCSSLVVEVMFREGQLFFLQRTFPGTWVSVVKVTKGSSGVWNSTSSRASIGVCVPCQKQQGRFTRKLALFWSLRRDWSPVTRLDSWNLRLQSVWFISGGLGLWQGLDPEKAVDCQCCCQDGSGWRDPCVLWDSHHLSGSQLQFLA